MHVWDTVRGYKGSTIRDVDCSYVATLIIKYVILVALCTTGVLTCCRLTCGVSLIFNMRQHQCCSVLKPYREPNGIININY